MCISDSFNLKKNNEAIDRHLSLNSIHDGIQVLVQYIPAQNSTFQAVLEIDPINGF